MGDFPTTIEIDGQPLTIQAPIASENGLAYQVLDAAGESLGAILIGRDGRRLSGQDRTVERVAEEAVARGIIESPSTS